MKQLPFAGEGIYVRKSGTGVEEQLQIAEKGGFSRRFSNSEDARYREHSDGA